MDDEAEGYEHPEDHQHDPWHFELACMEARGGVGAVHRRGEDEGEQEGGHRREGKDGGQQLSPGGHYAVEDGAQPSAAGQGDGNKQDGVEHDAPEVAAQHGGPGAAVLVSGVL